MCSALFGGPTCRNSHDINNVILLPHKPLAGLIHDEPPVMAPHELIRRSWPGLVCFTLTARHGNRISSGRNHGNQWTKTNAGVLRPRRSMTRGATPAVLTSFRLWGSLHAMARRRVSAITVPNPAFHIASFR